MIGLSVLRDVFHGYLTDAVRLRRERSKLKGPHNYVKVANARDIASATENITEAELLCARLSLQRA